MEQDFVLQMQDGIWWGTFPRFAGAGFLTACSCRLHGSGTLVPGTLNLALHVGDDPDRVRADRQRFANAIGVDAARFTTCAQVHGSRVEVVTADKVGSGALALQDGVLDGRPVRGTLAETDALITDLPDVPLLLFYADCTPVLLADPVTGAMGLAHAGWRGTAAEIAPWPPWWSISLSGRKTCWPPSGRPSDLAATRSTTACGTGCPATWSFSGAGGMGATCSTCGASTAASSRRPVYRRPGL